MTSSPSVIRQRRSPVSRGAVVACAAVVVCATVPVVLWQIAKFPIPDLGALFNHRTTTTTTAPTTEKKVVAHTPIKSPSLTNSVAWIQVLDKASKDLSVQIEKSPRDPALQNRQGLLYLSLGDLSASEQCFANAVSLCRASLSECTARMERDRAAGKMDNCSKELIAASQLTNELSAAHSHLARIYEQKGDRQRVMAELDQLNRDSSFFSGLALGGGKLQTNDGRLSPLEAQSLARAEMLLRSNRPHEAVSEYRRLATMNPKLAIPHERIGIVSAMSNDLPSAVQEWEIAARLDPQSATVQNNLGLAYAQLGMAPAARTAFEKAIDLNPASEEASLNLSNLLSADGDVDGAMQVLRNATKHSPTSARALNNLGSLQSLSGAYHDAIGSYHKALTVDPNMASAHYGMGVALIKTHSYLPAIKELKQALLINPKMQEAQTRIEEAYRLSSRSRS